jgi:hypothetical protein
MCQQELDHLHVPNLGGMVEGGLECVSDPIDVRASRNEELDDGQVSG